jgi:tetratricopeptide (TPR) repeat protein
MITQLVAALQSIDPEVTDKDIADALWLALQIRKVVGAPGISSETTHNLLPEDETHLLRVPSPESQPNESGLYRGSSQRVGTGQMLNALPFHSPAAPALPSSLDIARVLRPFRKHMPSQGTFVLNEEATAKRIAEEGIWVPVLDYALTRWLEVALVIDIGKSMTLWRQTIIELYRLLAYHGAFRDVRLWELDTNDATAVDLYMETGENIQDRQPRNELELIDTTGYRLILVVTDCVSPAWHNGKVTQVLEKWGHYNSVTLLQVLPRRLWSRTALGMGIPVHLHMATSGIANAQLQVQSAQFWDDEESLPTLRIPIVILEPRSLAVWARAIARAEDVWIPGFELMIHSEITENLEHNDYTLHKQALSVEHSAAELVQRFRTNASSPAWRLAGLLALLPITLPIVRLVQQAMFDEPQQVHIAEVFLSGLLEIISAESSTLNPDNVEYDFVNGVRDILLNFVPPNDSIRVLTEISALITSKFAHPFDFGALLAYPLGKESIVVDKENRPFALMGAKVLRRFGGEYTALADWLEAEGTKDEKQNNRVEELSVAPLPQNATLDAYRAIYDPDIPPASSIALIGREQVLAEARDSLLQKGNAVLTSLNGLPGVGKTTLAIALAYDEELREHFHDGMLWTSLGPDPNTQGQLRRWGGLLGLSYEEMGGLNSSEAWVTALRTVIGSRQMLLIIDDAWNVEESLMFKVGGPNCAHLVTTRFPAVGMTMGADSITTVSELNEEESMKLLCQIVPQLVEHEAKMAHDLVLAVGGLPLALTLIGNYLRTQAYSEQPRRIHAALEQLSNTMARLQLDEPRVPGESHPRLPVGTPLSLQSIIAVTDQQLEEQARSALYALSVFPAKPNSFSEEAALAITGDTVEVLDALADAGLLENSGSGRYTLHQTIADYARMQLREAAPMERLIDYANTFVEAHKTDYELLDQESSMILTALEAAYRLGKQQELVRGVSAFAPFLLLRGNYGLAERHVQRAYEAAITRRDRHSITNALLYKGEIASRQGNYAQAEMSFKEGLSIAQQINDSAQISVLLKDMGWMAWKQGNYEQAEVYLLEGLTIARQHGYLEQTSALLNVLGSLMASKGNYPQAVAYMEEGLILARQSGDREQICGLLLNLGVTVAEQGHNEQAVAYMEEGLTIARQIRHQEWTIVLLLNMGEMAVDQGDYENAEVYYPEALDLARKIGNREWVSVLLINMGKLAQKRGNYKNATEYLFESLKLAREISKPRIICVCLCEYGNLYLQQRQLEDAEASFSEMLALIPEGDQELLALAQYGLARVASAKGNISEAIRLGEISAKGLEAMEHRNAQEIKRWLESIMEDV